MSSPLVESPDVDRERDVVVAPFDLTMKYARGRKRYLERDVLWYVFLGEELIEHFDDRAAAIGLARKVSAKTRRPAWISTDGLTFEAIDSPAVRVHTPLTRN
jgi:hypothetical protein